MANSSSRQSANMSGTNYASFTFQVEDDGGTANGGVNLDPNPKTLTINVNNPNAEFRVNTYTLNVQPVP